MSDAVLETTALKPRDVAEAIRCLIPTGVSGFVWGAPGISKSKTAQQIATERGIAFIDLRLSQMDPTDLRGIPYPTQIHGRDCVRWSVPYALPVDLDFDFVEQIENPVAKRIVIGNPIGANGIPYCTKPRIVVTSVDPSLKAEIVKQYETDAEGEVVYFDAEGYRTTAEAGTAREKATVDRFYVILKDADGRPTTGAVRIQVTGQVAAIIGLEEFNSAPLSVQAAAYQFVLDRRLGDYILPDLVSIIGMGNRDTDKGVTYKMPTPIMNRFVHLEMEVDFDNWFEWAINNDIHPEVIGYLMNFKSDLFDFDAGTASRGFATPRSWEFVSKILWANPDLSPMVALGLIYGAIGDGIGAKFSAFRKRAAEMPDVAEVLAGRLKVLDKPLELDVEYAFASAVCYELRERVNKIKASPNWKASDEYTEWLAQADNFIGFILAENLQPEIGIMAARLATTVHKLPFIMPRMKNFKEFAITFRELVMN